MIVPAVIMPFVIVMVMAVVVMGMVFMGMLLMAVVMFARGAMRVVCVVVRAFGPMHMDLLDFRTGIGAAFGIEGRFDMGNLGAEPARHILDNGVASYPDAVGENLHGQMPVAEMIREAGKIARFTHTNFR